MNKNDEKLSEFNNTVVNAVSVIGHIWSQVDALKGKLDRELPSELKDVGFDIVEGEKDYDDEYLDSLQSVLTEWMWYYRLTFEQNGKRGRRPHAGWIYMMVRIMPIDQEAKSSTKFIPHISISIDHKECGQIESTRDVMSPAAYSSPENKNKGWKPLTTVLDLQTSFSNFECVDDDGLWSVVIHVPLGELRSDNIKYLLLEPVKKLAKYCKETWD